MYSRSTTIHDADKATICVRDPARLGILKRSLDLAITQSLGVARLVSERVVTCE